MQELEAAFNNAIPALAVLPRGAASVEEPRGRCVGVSEVETVIWGSHTPVGHPIRRRSWGFVTPSTHMAGELLDGVLRLAARYSHPMRRSRARGLHASRFLLGLLLAFGTGQLTVDGRRSRAGRTCVQVALFKPHPARGSSRSRGRSTTARCSHGSVDGAERNRTSPSPPVRHDGRRARTTTRSASARAAAPRRARGREGGVDVMSARAPPPQAGGAGSCDSAAGASPIDSVGAGAATRGPAAAARAPAAYGRARRATRVFRELGLGLDRQTPADARPRLGVDLARALQLCAPKGPRPRHVSDASRSA